MNLIERKDAVAHLASKHGLTMKQLLAEARAPAQGVFRTDAAQDPDDDDNEAESGDATGYETAKAVAKAQFKAAKKVAKDYYKAAKKAAKEKYKMDAAEKYKAAKKVAKKKFESAEHAAREKFKKDSREWSKGSGAASPAAETDEKPKPGRFGARFGEPLHEDEGAPLTEKQAREKFKSHARGLYKV